MSDMISRKAFVEHWNKEYRHQYANDTFLFALANFPAVDAVELPCKIGDTVWCIRNFHGHKHPQEGIVSEMLFTKEMKLLIRVKYVGCGHWGKKIFPTQEEAEAAINKKENEVN